MSSDHLGFSRDLYRGPSGPFPQARRQPRDNRQVDRRQADLTHRDGADPGRRGARAVLGLQAVLGQPGTVPDGF